MGINQFGGSPRRLSMVRRQAGFYSSRFRFLSVEISLVGGRLDIHDGHNVAALGYSRRKHIINVFTWPCRGTESIFAGSGSQQGYNRLRWKSGDTEFSLVSDASAVDVRELKDLIHQ